MSSPIQYGADKSEKLLSRCDVEPSLHIIGTVASAGKVRLERVIDLGQDRRARHTEYRRQTGERIKFLPAVFVLTQEKFLL